MPEVQEPGGSWRIFGDFLFARKSPGCRAERLHQGGRGGAKPPLWGAQRGAPEVRPLAYRRLQEPAFLQMDPQGPLAKKRETWYNKKAVYNFLKKEKADPEGRTLCPKGRRPVPGPRALTIRLMEASLPSRPSLSIANFFGRKESIEEQIL